MTRLFAEQRRDARLTGGTAIVWFRVAGDTLRTAPREHGYLIAQDLRHAWRSLVRAPGLAAVAVSTLAIGIGATTAMFSIAHAVLWLPLPFSNPSALVSVAEARLDTRVPTYSSLANYADWRDQQRTFDRIAAYTDLTFNLTGVADPERLRAIQMSASLLPLLGIEPFMGRNFVAAEDRQGAAPAAILSHQLWRRTFGSDPHIVGRAIALNDRTFTIVGVMPVDFQFPVQVDPINIYTPIEIDDFEQMRARDGRLIQVIARLKQGVTQAAAEHASILRPAVHRCYRLEQQFGVCRRRNVHDEETVCGDHASIARDQGHDNPVRARNWRTTEGVRGHAGTSASASRDT